MKYFWIKINLMISNELRNYDGCGILWRIIIRLYKNEGKTLISKFAQYKS